MQYVISQLSKAKRPLILAGGGVRASRAIEPFRKLVDLLGVPVVNSLMGVDVLPYTHPLRVGMIGSYGNRWANIALGTADFILVLGSRLDIRQTGADTTSFKGDRVIVHVDCEPGEINNRVVGCASIVADLNSFLVAAIDALPVERLRNYDEWQHKIKTLQDEWPDVGELKDAQGINPNLLMHQISKRSQSAAAFVVDVGQHQMWAAQSLELQDNQRFLTSGGMGSMGFALPAAIGAAFATRDTPIVTIAGDGGFQCNLQELQTVIRNKLPIKIVVLNNQCHGMVRQFQDSYFDGRLQSTKWGYSAPNFERISEAFGIRGRTITTGEDTEKALEWLWQDELSPALLQVMIDPKTNVYPKLAFGKGITEMEPFSKPVEMEGT